MVRRPMDVAPARVSFPDVGLGRGWEPPVLLALTLMLFAFGLVTLYSASSFFARTQGNPDHFYVLRQATGGAVGLVALAVCARIPFRFWETMAWPLVVATFALLVVVILPGTEGIAPRINGARRWLQVGVTIQPSEFAKIAMIVWTAMMAVRKQDQFGRLSKGLGPFLAIWGLLLIPVALQPDLSTAMLTGLLGALTLFAAGARIGHFIFLAIICAPVLAQQLLVGFRFDRWIAWLSPTADSQGAGWQLWQSLIAVGSGGLTGRGFGEGQQKFGFVPEPHNDFIFAMVGEEWGLMGVTFVIVMYTALILIGFRVARRAPTLFGQLLAVGCTNLIALQAVLHISVGLGLVPTTGLALPLVSYGRSNLLVIFIAIGILMSIARETDLDWSPDTRERTRRSDLTRDVRRAGPRARPATAGGRG
ncbi:MAG TPA: putative peptidoglycan glycosyltransferase FtsW [Longimicrobiales bacterium]|nr:putative peptidoglycan glycosyltransferase FtsW [Longimicrobiales bacterium]